MKFLNDIVLTGAGADLTAPATVTFSGLSATTETNAVVINSSGVLSKRTLGSNAFNSTGIPTGNAIIDWTASGAGTIHASNYIENVVQTTVSGNAGTVTNGAYTNANQTFSGNNTFNSPIIGDIKIKDTRSSGDVTPANFPTTSASFSFTDDFGGLGSWYSGITMKGWSGNYAAWQLIAEADSSAGDNELYFRTGSASTWGTIRTVAMLDGTQTFTGAKTFTGTVAITGTGRITGIDTVDASTDAASKAYVDGAVIANTDTQDLSISGQTLSLTNGGSVTLPDTNTVYTHPTSAGNKHVPTGGASGQFLKYTSSGTAVWATPSYTTNTNTTYSTATSSTLGLVKIGYTESGKNYPVELSSGKMYVNVPWANTQNNDEEDAAEGTKGVVELATNDEVIEGTDSGKATTSRGVKGAIDGIAVPILGNKTIGGVKTFSSTIVGSVNGNSATTSERTITSGEISNISTNTSKVGITTGSQTIAGSKTFSSPIKGQVIGIASHSGYINKTAAQFASDGTDKVYIGSNNYGWNDSRDTATNLVDVDAPVINQNDQHNGIICPVNLSQVSIMSQVRMNAADGTMQVRVYKMARATGVNTSNLALTQIATASVSTVNGRMTTLDATGSTAVSAGDLIIVGFGKTSGGNGQKPRINFTLTGTTV